MNLRNLRALPICGLLAAVLLLTCRMDAQHLTLEGQTGGFLTPTAYVVYVAKDQVFSHPVVGYHYVNSNAVIGDIHTISVTEGFANRAEVGYTRSAHVAGNSATFSNLWNYSGMNIVHGKAVAIKDGQFGSWTPGVAVGGLVRTGDHFISGHLDGKTYTNGDVYVVATKTWLKRPLPLALNFGWKATNASIFGIGGQSTRFSGRFFGGLGFPLPGPKKTAIVPSVGFMQEPPQVKNLSTILAGGKAHIPTTLDYAVRITQKDDPHFSFDIGVGQIAGQIGTTIPQMGGLPVNLQARKVLGMGLSYRY